MYQTTAEGGQEGSSVARHEEYIVQSINLIFLAYFTCIFVSLSGYTCCVHMLTMIALFVWVLTHSVRKFDIDCAQMDV